MQVVSIRCGACGESQDFGQKVPCSQFHWLQEQPSPLRDSSILTLLWNCSNGCLPSRCVTAALRHPSLPLALPTHPLVSLQICRCPPRHCPWPPSESPCYTRVKRDIRLERCSFRCPRSRIAPDPEAHGSAQEALLEGRPCTRKERCVELEPFAAIEAMLFLARSIS